MFQVNIRARQNLLTHQFIIPTENPIITVFRLFVSITFVDIFIILWIVITCIWFGFVMNVILWLFLTKCTFQSNVMLTGGYKMLNNSLFACLIVICLIFAVELTSHWTFWKSNETINKCSQNRLTVLDNCLLTSSYITLVVYDFGHSLRIHIEHHGNSYQSMCALEMASSTHQIFALSIQSRRLEK